MYKQFEEKLSEISREKFGKSLKALDKDEIYSVIGELVKEKCDSHQKESSGKRIAYFSIEYLIGRLLWSNLYNMKNTDFIICKRQIKTDGKIYRLFLNTNSEN